MAREEFPIIGGLLYHQRPDGSEKDLVMPQGLKQTALELNHDLPSSGHQEKDRTKAWVKEKFFWYGLGREVKQFVATCPTCNQNKKATANGRVPMQEYQTGAPMERVHIGFLGPLPKTPRGNEYVLMMVDQFTKWVECVPLPSQTAGVTAKAAVDGFFARFGYPFQIFTDQGRNFESKLFTALCEALEIHKARTTPYTPSANGQVERYTDGCSQMLHQRLSGPVGSAPATDCRGAQKFHQPKYGVYSEPSYVGSGGQHTSISDVPAAAGGKPDYRPVCCDVDKEHPGSTQRC